MASRKDSFWEYSPPREEGWTRHQERCREASFNGADGVVAHNYDFGMRFEMACERPPHLRGIRWLCDFLSTAQLPSSGSSGGGENIGLSQGGICSSEIDQCCCSYQ